MTVYEECVRCEKYIEYTNTDYIAGIGLVCKTCSKIIRDERDKEQTTIL